MMIESRSPSVTREFYIASKGKRMNNTNELTSASERSGMSHLISDSSVGSALLLANSDPSSYRESLMSVTSSSLKPAHKALEQMDHGNQFTIFDPEQLIEVSNKTTIAANGRRCVDTQYKDGTSEHDEFDPSSGKLLSADATDAHGGKVHEDFDPATGNLIDKKMADGTGRDSTTTYDPVTGVRKSTDAWDGAAYIHTEYDQVTDKPSSSEMRFNDGTVERTQYDPNSGNRQFTDIQNTDGSKTHYQYGPDGQLTSTDTTRPDGTTTHEPFHSSQNKKGSEQTPWWELNPVGLVERWISN
jgi:hypothetical protein